MKRVILGLDLPERSRAVPEVWQQMLPLSGAAVSPHVTLGRFKLVKPEQAFRLGRAVAVGARCCAAPVTAHKMVLPESHPGRGGSRYEMLARYPLSR